LNLNFENLLKISADEDGSL